MKNKKAFILHLAVILLVLGGTIFYAGCMGSSVTNSSDNSAVYVKTADNTSDFGVAGQVTNTICSGCIGQCGVVACNTCFMGCLGCGDTCLEGCAGCMAGCSTAMDTVNNT